MSGLAVLFQRDGKPTEEALVRRMLAAAAYRGPDGHFVTSWGNVTLGYAKMAVTPEEQSERQPLISPRTGCAIIADVRLDNRDELLSQLPEHPGREISDADIILRAFDAWGTEALTRLLGDFAIVIWDPRQQRLLCARDSSGQRPLHYRIDRKSFAAASEIQQLFQDPAVRIAPNEERIREFLVPFNMMRNRADSASTFYEGIFSVPAGHALTVDRVTNHVEPFWRLEAPTEIRYRRDAEYAEHYRALFFEVVRTRLRSVGPIGGTLSGGFDSSSVVCAAQELYRAGHAEDRGFVSFSFTYGDLECDESEFIRSVPAKYGFDARYIPAVGTVSSLQLEPNGFMPTPGRTISGLDPLFRAATESGVRVLLTGDVADACTFGSPHVFDSVLRQGHFGEFLSRLRAYRRTSTESLRKIVAIYCLLPLLPLGIQRRLTWAYIQRVLDRDESEGLFSWLPVSLGAELKSRHRRLVDEFEKTQPFASPARRLEYRMLSPPEEPYSPNGWPLQIWRPFADRRLHSFLLAIPPEQKFAPHPYSDEYYAGAKLLVRRAFNGILPEIIRSRTEKSHFASVFEDEIKRDWPVYEAAFGPNGRSEVAQRGIIDSAAFWTSLNELHQGDWGPDLMYIMNVVSLETWLRSLNLPRAQLIATPIPFDGRQLVNAAG